MATCWWCVEGAEAETYEPCEDCASTMRAAVPLIEVSNDTSDALPLLIRGEPVYPTGTWLSMPEAQAMGLFDGKVKVQRGQMLFLTSEAWGALGLPRLPRGV